MAGTYTDKNGNHTIRFVGVDRRRHNISIGKADAEQFKRYAFARGLTHHAND
jgi:hypothetical protein